MTVRTVNIFGLGNSRSEASDDRASPSHLQGEYALERFPRCKPCGNETSDRPLVPDNRNSRCHCNFRGFSDRLESLWPPCLHLRGRRKGYLFKDFLRRASDARGLRKRFTSHAVHLIWYTTGKEYRRRLRLIDVICRSPCWATYHNDRVVFLNTSSATSWYQHQCRLRNKLFLTPAGKYFLDTSSGAVAYPEYLDYSSHYRRRICVDLSITGLRESRRKVGDRGLYVVADLTRLPFRDGTFDGAVCSHVLYHVPEDEQESAVKELHRVTRRQSQFCTCGRRVSCQRLSIR
jgi:hypothetical protein